MNSYLTLAAAMLIAGCNSQPSAPSAPPLAGARIGGPFALTDQNGQSARDSDFAGRYRIMYFGYTYCPDVCPVDVQTIAAAVKTLERRDPAAAAKLVPIFVTVDPERDTQPVVKQFVSAFHPRMVGLTGSVAEVSALAKAYGVYHAQREPTKEGGYLVDHSRQAYLMGPKGDPIALLPIEGGAEKVADELQRWVQ